MDIAHRGFIEYENRISGILAGFRVVDMVEVDVRFCRETRVCHDRDRDTTSLQIARQGSSFI